MTDKPIYEELEKNGELYRQIFEASIIGLVRTEIVGDKILAANQAFAKMFGYESVGTLINESAISKHYASPENREKILGILKEKRRVDNYTIELLKKDGTRFFGALSAMIYPDRGYIEGAIVDITEKVHAKKNLEKLYDIVNKSPAVAFLRKNAENWPVEYVSENVAELLGYSAGDFISGKVAYSEIIHPDDIERVTEDIVRYSSEQKREKFKHAPYRIVTQKGEIKWILDRTFILRNERGEITHYQGLVIDVTNRIKTEAILESIIESPENVVIFALDREYRYLSFNKSHQRVMNRIWGANIALGHCMLDYITNPDDCEKAKNNFDRALSGESFTVEEAYGDIDLERRYYQDFYSPIADKKDNIIGLSLILIDITNRKQMEQEQDRLISELQKSLEEIKELRGILPICSNCKKIRDDKGYWTQIESYIGKHSEAQFSHAICPDCAEKFYNNLYTEAIGGKTEQDGS